jgi:DNA helicase II / ATP-dependent DNA helicase PcrA
MKITLNKAQLEAVDHIYGPLLVLAGPGTGKTQLLSARIANILEKTDANAQNILCLTFTENAAQNMRDRLTSMIGTDAYDVHINTYHGFGSDIIRSYPQYFEDTNLETGEDSRLERPIDDLQRIQIIEKIVNQLSYDSPLIGSRYYIKDVTSSISELKRGLYTPNSLRALGIKNLEQVQRLSPKIADELKYVKTFPGTADKSIALFQPILDILQGQDGLAEMAREELEISMAEVAESGKSSANTKWKNSWLSKDHENRFVFTNVDQHQKTAALADIFEKYQKALEESKLYDFDDMILRSIGGMKNNDELRFNLQEKYQFILLDEFQDTNAAQFELVKQLADNPVHEGQPNVFAVGDDDQAIYAFQGARVSNMLQFCNEFKPVPVINLTENYRSHPDILHTAHNISSQIESRLHHNLENVEKTLTASAKHLPEDSTIERHEFSSLASENAWVANRIKKLIAEGTRPAEIAVLAPKHKYLEHLIPFLSHNKTPVSYEKREDILQTPLLKAFKLMIQLVLAAQNDDEMLLNTLLPQVLSLEFYGVPVIDIWKINWAHKSGGEDRSWAEIALDNDTLAPHVAFYLGLGLKSANEPLEYVLDYLTGSSSLAIDEESSYTSPLKQFYFTDRHTSPLEYYESLANLSTIREHLRAYQSGKETPLEAQDFINFFAAYESAEQPLINTHPIAQAQESVQLMTVYKAKGLEFEHVFLLAVHDDVWGSKARSNNSKVSLPANLQHVRYQGSSEDELRRLLFVAVSRAKHGLYLTSHANKDSGKSTEPVKYLLEYTNEERKLTTVLPKSKQLVRQTAYPPAETMKHIELLWESRHLKLDASLKSLLKPRLEKYQMSPTHLNTFIDTEYGGPDSFLLQTLLRFPQAPGDDGEFGNAVHATLEWVQRKIEKDGWVIQVESVLKKFNEIIKQKYIPAEAIEDFRNRGHNALKAYIVARTEMFAKTAKAEVDFRLEGVLINNAHLSGKIDRIEINAAEKSINIVDFKTGKPHTKWEREVKLLKYKQQLYFYKFLIEGSHSWVNYKVAEARLEFVEPDSNGNIVEPLKINFDAVEEKEMKQLIDEIWKMIQELNLPDISTFSPDYKGTVSFINSIIKK